MSCPQNKLFALTQGFQAFNGKMLGTLDVSEDLPAGMLDRMLADMVTLCEATEKRTLNDQRGIGFKNEYAGISVTFRKALRLADM